MFAVAGASANRSKYGNKVLRAYLQRGYPVVAIHPTELSVEGTPTFPNLASATQPIESLSIVTPPSVTQQIVTEAIACGVKNLWMQPGAEHPQAIASAQAAGLVVIHGGPCLLVQLGYHE